VLNWPKLLGSLNFQLPLQDKSGKGVNYIITSPQLKSLREIGDRFEHWWLKKETKTQTAGSPESEHR